MKNFSHYKNSNWVLALVPFLCGLMAFSPALFNHFALDDHFRILNDPEVVSSELGISILLKPTWPGNLYRPLLTWFFSLQHAVAHFSPMLWHATSLLLHGCVAGLGFLIFTRITSRKIALLAAVIFALHPIHTEAVANINGQAELLCAFFGLLSLTLLLKPKLNLVGSFLAFIFLLLALLAKESALVLPVLYLIIVWYRKDALNLNKVFIAALAPSAYLSLRYYVMGNLLGFSQQNYYLDNPLIELSWVERIPMALALLGKYIGMCLIPWPLSSDYSFDHLQTLFSGFEYPLYFAAGLALFLCAGWEASKRSLLALGSLWFFASFLVTSNLFFAIGTIFAERLAYLPSAGICLILAYLLSSTGPAAVRQAMGAVIMISYAIACLQMGTIWRDNFTLHTYQIDVSPQSARTQFNFAVAQKKQGKLDIAHRHFVQALQIYPKYTEAMQGLGAVFLEKGIFSRAEYWLKEALKQDPQHIASIKSLVGMYIIQNRAEEARELIKQGQSFAPDDKELAAQSKWLENRPKISLLYDNEANV